VFWVFKPPRCSLMATMNCSATAHDTPRAVISTRNNSSGVFALLQWRTAAPSVATDRVGNDNAIAATITESDSVKKAHLRRRVIGGSAPTSSGDASDVDFLGKRVWLVSCGHVHAKTRV
jgi:hypothetical protein